MKLADQLPLDVVTVAFRVTLMIIKRTMAPDSKRKTVKLDASIALFSSASRHSTELADNAINARQVRMIVLNKELLIIFFPERA
jgi:hypothetical protein